MSIREGVIGRSRSRRRSAEQSSGLSLILISLPVYHAAAGEEVMPARLEDAAAVLALCEGVSAIVHLGGVSTERPWDEILPANIVGTYHLSEAARRQRVKRIVFASSNHVTGFYRQDETIDTLAPPRPDGLYGVSKAFGRTCRGCTSTATASRPFACESARPSRNRRTGACSPPG